MTNFIRALFFFLLCAHTIHGTPQYYCTAANWPYFHRLINLIGSIHKHNYNDLEETRCDDLFK